MIERGEYSISVRHCNYLIYRPLPEFRYKMSTFRSSELLAQCTRKIRMLICLNDTRSRVSFRQPSRFGTTRYQRVSTEKPSQRKRGKVRPMLIQPVSERDVYCLCKCWPLNLCLQLCFLINSHSLHTIMKLTLSLALTLSASLAFASDLLGPKPHDAVLQRRQRSSRKKAAAAVTLPAGLSANK